MRLTRADGFAPRSGLRVTSWHPAVSACQEFFVMLLVVVSCQSITYVPGLEMTPASTVSPVLLIAWKNSSLPDTSISMK